MKLRMVTVVLVVSLAAYAGDEPAPDCLRTVPDHAACASTGNPATRRLFSCPERGEILTAAGIDRAELPSLFDGIVEEDALVRAALRRVTVATALDGRQRAALWEELSSIIERRIEHPVSQGYIGDWNGRQVYVFQGMRRFEGQVYLLVLLPDGAGLTGRTEPIEDISTWRTRLSLLAPLR